MKAEEFGPTVREFRKAQHLTLRELSERTDIPIHRISEYELNKRKLSLDKMNILMDALDLELKIVVVKKKKS